MLAVMYVLIARVSTNYAMIGRDPTVASIGAQLVAAISLLVFALGRISYVAVENPSRRWLTKLLIGPPQKSAAAATPAA